MGANPHANGGLLRKRLAHAGFPRLCRQSRKTRNGRGGEHSSPRSLPARHHEPEHRANFRVFGPDENTSNRLDAIYEVSKKLWIAEYFPKTLTAENCRATGGSWRCLASIPWRVGSKAICSPAATASSRPTKPSFTSLIPCSTSTPSGCRSATDCPGGAVISLNLLITSTVWRQDHNGFTHQDPGFLDVVVNKSAGCTPSSTCRPM